MEPRNLDTLESLWMNPHLVGEQGVVEGEVRVILACIVLIDDGVGDKITTFFENRPKFKGK
jgi:hypothetical protein